MKFLVNGDFNNKLLRIILGFALMYILLLWVTNILLYIEKIGFTYNSVVGYYLGSEEEFKNPISYRGLLEVTHVHLFVFAFAFLLLNHLTVFSNIPRYLKLFLILTSFISGFLDMGLGWLIRFVSPWYAYPKIWSFIIFQLSMLILLISSFFALSIYRKGEEEKKDGG